MVEYKCKKEMGNMSKAEFIEDMVKNYEEVAVDLQGIVEARCMRTGEDEEEILRTIYSRI